MIASDVSRCAVVAVLAAVDATGHLTFTLLIVLTLLNGLGDGFFFPAVGGIVPLVVEQAALPSANSLIGVARWGSFIVGPELVRSGRLGPSIWPATTLGGRLRAKLPRAGWSPWSTMEAWTT